MKNKKYEGATNPFEMFERNKKARLEQRDNKKSTFIKKGRVNFDHVSKKRQKLQLYNLNDETFTLTHNNQPIEEHYESDIDQDSDIDDEPKFRGDFTNISQTLESYKKEQQLRKKQKLEQRQLLTKLDSQYNDLNLNKYFKPPRKQDIYKPVETKVRIDKFDENLKKLQLNPLIRSEDVPLRWVGSLENVKDLEGFRRMTKDFVDTGGTVVANHTTTLEVFVRLLNVYLDKYKKLTPKLFENEESSKFTEYFDLFVRGFCIICNCRQTESKGLIADLLSDITGEGVPEFNLENVLFTYLIIKIVNVNSKIYKFCLSLLEYWLKMLNVEDIITAKLLISASYAVILETGFYIPYFYHFCMKLCTTSKDNKLITNVLNLVKITLNVLKANNCHIHSILLDIIIPKLALEDNILEEYTKQEVNQTLFKYTLNVYLQKDCRIEVPKIKPRRKAKRYDGKSEYKELKKGLLRDTLEKIAIDNQLKFRKHIKAQQHYKQIVKDSYAEQEMLKKMSTTTK